MDDRTMQTRHRTESTGARTREFARIERAAGEPTSDPKTMAMTRARPAAGRDMSEARDSARRDD